MPIQLRFEPALSRVFDDLQSLIQYIIGWIYPVAGRGALVLAVLNPVPSNPEKAQRLLLLRSPTGSRVRSSGAQRGPEVRQHVGLAPLEPDQAVADPQRAVEH